MRSFGRGLGVWMALGVMCACSDDPGVASNAADGGAGTSSDGSVGQTDAWSGLPDSGDAAADVVIEPPASLEPCENGACWSAPSLLSSCGTGTVDEDFSTGLYNVHQFALTAPATVELDLTLKATGGGFEPALLLQDEQGATLFDGEKAQSTSALAVQGVSSGRGSDTARVRVTSQSTRQLSLFVTGWQVVDAAFVPPMPGSAAYTLTNFADCEAQTGPLLSPPNFDPNNVVGGYYLLPPSEPPGLYTRKPDDCSRGTKLLIDVLYTVAYHWKTVRPALSPINIADLNEGSCSTVNHATHDDGTHADLSAGCATQIACADIEPAIELAKLFVDTGEVCGIIFNDDAVQNVINPYFASKFSYAPWNGQFMRTVSGHTHHFHVRVKKPNGLCN